MFAKSANMISKFLQKRNMGAKTQNFMLTKKLQKTRAKKVISEKVTEQFFDFFIVCKSFFAYSLFGELFCTFFDGFNISIEVCVL
jgi:hypothetical protein